MPTPEQVERAIQIMRRQSVNVTYFFTKLDDPTWLEPLRERGLLGDPPELIADGNGVLRGTHLWPQAEYLKRMARKNDRQVKEQVLEIMESVAGTHLDPDVVVAVAATV